MARDVNDMILESFGRHSDRKGKRNRRSSFSDDEGFDDTPINIQHDYDSDEDDFDHRGSKMPLKKRIDKDDDVDDDPAVHPTAEGGYTSDASFSDGVYDEDLFKDEADKQRLMSMSELQREMVLADRAEKKDNQNLRMKAAQRLKKDVADKPREREAKKQQRNLDQAMDQSPPVRSRSSGREDAAKAVREDALNKLLAAKKKSGELDGQRRQKETPQKLSRPSMSQDSNGSGSHDADKDDADDKYNDDGLTYEDIANITIRRSKLAKWFLEPFFEEIIVGCFVRVGVCVRDNQSYYRLCQVKNVDARDPLKQYKFEKRMTHKWLNLVWGDSEARWQMTRISDQPPTEVEFDQWKKEMLKSDSRKPSPEDVLEKREAINNLSSFVYSAALVKQMLQEKKMASSRPSNVAAEKDRLLKELAFAESKDDYDEVEKIQSRVKDLEAYSLRSRTKDAKAIALAEMNKRNRFENFKNASDLKPANIHAKAGEAGYDPFSRRWTRSQNYYSRSSKSDNAEATKASVAATAAAQEAAADAGKLVDTLAPVSDDTKLFSLHDFDLPISLHGIQKFGGAQGAHLAYIARKQRLEATCGVPIQNNDGRRHMLTLTVNDYKRRRGLL